MILDTYIYLLAVLSLTVTLAGLALWRSFKQGRTRLIKLALAFYIGALLTAMVEVHGGGGCITTRDFYLTGAGCLLTLALLSKPVRELIID